MKKAFFSLMLLGFALGASAQGMEVKGEAVLNGNLPTTVTASQHMLLKPVTSYGNAQAIIESGISQKPYEPTSYPAPTLPAITGGKNTEGLDMLNSIMNRKYVDDVPIVIPLSQLEPYKLRNGTVILKPKKGYIIK